MLWRGAPEGTRTPDLLVRSQTLYPAELLAQIKQQPLQAALQLYHICFKNAICFYNCKNIFTLRDPAITGRIPYCKTNRTDYLLENCGARLAPFRPYFLRSFILGSRVKKPAFFSAGRNSSSYWSNARDSP